MKTAAIAALALAMAAASPALARDATPEEAAKITALLAEMQCEMDPAEIEVEEGAPAQMYELDDVFCADGQYDIGLNAEFDVVEKRKE